MAEKNLTLIVDPLEEIQSLLQGFGFYDSIARKFLASDYPMGTDDEYLRHYLFGVGKPFINFLVFVDVGVGYDIEVDSGSESQNREIKEEINTFLQRIGYQTTLIQFATYLEVLGRSCIVKTKNMAGDDYYFSEYENVTGIDVINPITLDRESVKKSLNDKTGKLPFIQKYHDNEGVEQEVELKRDRVIYSTKNPFTRNAVDGVSTFSNCLNELRLAARYPRYKSQLAEKTSKLHRHFQVDTAKFGELKQGRDILSSQKKSKNYLHKIHRMINDMNEKGSDVATMDYINSKEVTYAGRVPDITSMEKGVFESLAMKMEIPLNTMTYGSDVNRATLEVLSDIFVRRRETGSQLEYKRISDSIIEEFLVMKGFDNVTATLKFKPFLPDDINEMFNIVSAFASRLNGILSATEIRRLIGRPDKIEYGEADKQMDDQLNDMMSKVQPPVQPVQPQVNPLNPEGVPEAQIIPDYQPTSGNLEELESKLDEIIYGMKTCYHGDRK